MSSAAQRRPFESDRWWAEMQFCSFLPTSRIDSEAYALELSEIR